MGEKWLRDRKNAIFRENLAASSALPPYVIGLLLAGCGGGGGGGGVAPQVINLQRASVSGLVFDGPVRDAVVWLDVNRDGVIDSGDFRIGVTGADGRYSYTIELPAEHVSGSSPNKPLIVDLTNARDIDAPETPLAGTWRAPAGSRIISPLTEFIVATDNTPQELAMMLNLPTSVDITRFDPYTDQGSQNSENSMRVLAAGQVVAAEITRMQNGGGGTSVEFSPEFIEGLPSAVGGSLTPNSITTTLRESADSTEARMITLAELGTGVEASGDINAIDNSYEIMGAYMASNAMYGTFTINANGMWQYDIVPTMVPSGSGNLTETITIDFDPTNPEYINPPSLDLTFTIERLTPLEVRHSFNGNTDENDLLTPANTITRITLADHRIGYEVRGHFRAWLPDDMRLNQPDIFNELNELIQPSDGEFGATGNAMVYLDVNDNGMLDIGVDTVHDRAPGGIAFFLNSENSFGRWGYGVESVKALGAGKDLIHVIPVSFFPATTLNYAPPEPVSITFIIERSDAVVDEGATHTISMDELNNEGATYTITTLPTHGMLLRDGVPLRVNDTFTQADIQVEIDDNLIISLISYVHDGSETTTDNFAYTLGDGSAGSFDFAVSPVNDVVELGGDKVADIGKGATYTLTTDDLSATDGDHSASQLQYIITTAPMHGTLYKGSEALAVNGTFTQADIDNNRITYEHDNSEMLNDSFAFRLTDTIEAVLGSFTLFVSDRLDSPPTAMTLSQSSYEFTEGATTPRTLAVASFTDDRLGRNSFTISGDTHGLFEAHGHRLQLKRGFNLDFEQEGDNPIPLSYTIMLTATTNSALTQSFTLTTTDRTDEDSRYVRITSPDTGRWTLTDQKPFYHDRNMPLPDQNRGIAERYIYEITTEQRDDTRIEEERMDPPIHYDIIGGDAHLFELEKLTGRVSFIDDEFTPDYEHKSSYNFTVVAVILDGKDIVATKNVTIAVANDNDPFTVRVLNPRMLVDNEVIGTAPVYTANATFNDVSWSLEGGDSQYFRINSDGMIRFFGEGGSPDSTARANFERKPSYSFTVVATGVGTFAGEKARHDITIEVADRPETTFFTQIIPATSEPITIPENVAVGDTAYSFTIASDQPAIIPTISYGDSEAFEINPLGQNRYNIRFVDGEFMPDYEAQDEFGFLLHAVHTLDDTIDDKKWVSISVTNDSTDDADPTPPVGLGRTIYENYPIHKGIPGVDLSPVGSELQLTPNYKDNHLFAIRDERVMWLASPDYETPLDANSDNIYEIEVTHQTQMTDPLRLAITVEDIVLENKYTTMADTPGSANHHPSVAGGVSKMLIEPHDFLEDELPPIEIQEIIWGPLWKKTSLAPITLTWSLDLNLEEARDTYSRNYIEANNRNFEPTTNLNSENQAGIDRAREDLQRAFDEIERAANLKFIEVNEDDTNVGDISIKIAARTYPDEDGPRSIFGAAFLGAGSPQAVVYFMTIEDHSLPTHTHVLHELLHVLGVAHPFDARNGWLKSPSRYHDPDTLISYYPNRLRGPIEEGKDGTEKMLQQQDIEVLQYLYGAPPTDPENPELSGVEMLYLV